MEEEKKMMSKETKKLLIIISSFIAVVIIVGVVFGVVFPQLNKKEVQTSSQLENENIQEEKKEEENTIPNYIELSDTSFTGATFKKKWSEFKQETDNYYNQKYKDSVAITKENSLTTKYNSNNVEYAIFKYYKYSTYSISPKLVAGYCVQVDTKTDNIIGIYYTFFSDKVDIDEYAFDFPVFLDLIVKDTLKENLEYYLNKTTQEESNWNYYKDNVILYTIKNNKQISISVCATGGKETEYFKESGQWRILQTANTETQNSNNTNSTVVADIQDRIEFFNSYYAWNFHPTNEQMQQMVEFANSTSNFTNDTLADFIIDKGWLPDSGTGTVSSNNSSSTTTTNNGNSGSSNKNTSSSSNDDDNTNREVIATVNINLKELIAKNTVATEIKNESERIDIRVYVEDAFVKDDYFEYFSGGASVPNTITTTVKVYENEKKLNDKRKVIITMDNTRTLIKETTLYDGEMIFNKTGTYEIK